MSARNRFRWIIQNCFQHGTPRSFFVRILNCGSIIDFTFYSPLCGSLRQRRARMPQSIRRYSCAAHKCKVLFLLPFIQLCDGAFLKFVLSLSWSCFQMLTTTTTSSSVNRWGIPILKFGETCLAATFCWVPFTSVIRLVLMDQDRGVCAVFMLDTRGQYPKIKRSEARLHVSKWPSLTLRLISAVMNHSLDSISQTYINTYCTCRVG